MEHIDPCLAMLPRQSLADSIESMERCLLFLDCGHGECGEVDPAKIEPRLSKGLGDAPRRCRGN